MKITIVIVQTILHYLGLVGIVLGVIAFLVGNTSRGKELFFGGLSFLVLKYAIGFLFQLVAHIFAKKNDRENKAINSSEKES